MPCSTTGSGGGGEWRVSYQDRHEGAVVFLLVLAKIGQGLSLREVGCRNDLFLHLLGLLRFTVAAFLSPLDISVPPDFEFFLAN
jgi:hypothetical protein